MTLLVKTGSFNKSIGAPGSTDVINVGFQPKALFLWGMDFIVADGEFIANQIPGYGFSDGVNHRCISNKCQLAAPRQNTAGEIRNDSVISFLGPGDLSPTIPEPVRVRATVVFNPTDFTLTWVLNQARATEINYIVWGGDDITGVQVGDFASPNVIGDLDVPTDADVRGITDGNGVLMIGHTSPGAAPTPVFNTAFADMTYQIGMSSHASDPVVNSQQVTTGYSEDDNQAGTRTEEGFRNDAILDMIRAGGGGAERRATHKAWLDDGTNGFQLNFSNVGVLALQVPMMFMIIKGAKWQVGKNEMPTGAGPATQGITTPFQPKAVIFTNPKRAASLGVGENGFDSAATNPTIGFWHNHHIGASDGVDEVSSTIVTGLTGDLTNNYAGAHSTTKSLRILEKRTAVAPIVLAEANIQSFNPADFTLNYDAGDLGTLPYVFGWLAMGEEVAVQVLPRKTKGVRILEN